MSACKQCIAKWGEDTPYQYGCGDCFEALMFDFKKLKKVLAVYEAVLDLYSIDNPDIAYKAQEALSEGRGIMEGE